MFETIDLIPVNGLYLCTYYINKIRKFSLSKPVVLFSNCKSLYKNTLLQILQNWREIFVEILLLLYTSKTVAVLSIIEF